MVHVVYRSDRDWYCGCIMFYYVYVLQSELDNKFYIGYSKDVHQRLKDHNSGKNVSTKNRRPFTLIFFEAYRNKSDALRREEYLKTTKGKAVIRAMLKQYLHHASAELD